MPRGFMNEFNNPIGVPVKQVLLSRQWVTSQFDASVLRLAWCPGIGFHPPKVCVLTPAYS
jgi:hypothetical protein